jgi:hypothetical protein
VRENSLRRNCKGQYRMIHGSRRVSVYQLVFPVGQSMRSCGGPVMPNSGAAVKPQDKKKEGKEGRSTESG